MVMATGIIAVASSQQGIDWLADVLYVVAAVMYVVLIVTLLGRIIRFPRRSSLKADDLASLRRGASSAVPRYGVQATSVAQRSAASMTTSQTGSFTA